MEVVGGGDWRGGKGLEVTGVGGGYQGNRVKAQQGVRDGRRGSEVEKGKRKGGWEGEERACRGGSETGDWVGGKGEGRGREMKQESTEMERVRDRQRHQ